MNFFKSVVAISSVLFFSLNESVGQYKSPVEYMDALSSDQVKVSEQYLAYASSVAHGKSARKVEKTRKELIKSVDNVRQNAKKIGPYNDDISLRDAMVNYFDISYNILVNDYEKLVDMEEIAEQSYDDMEAYILAQGMVDEKMKEASENLQIVYLAFAANNNVNIIDHQSQLDLKMKKIAETNAYHNKIYLIFFKSFNQHRYLQKAIEENDVNGIEQNKNTLIKYSTQGLESLNEIKSFKNDRSLLDASKKLLQFYLTNCEKNIPLAVTYIMEKEKFEEIKKAFDSKSKKSKEEVDKYNQAVNDMNNANNQYNQALQHMNQSVQLTENWNNGVKSFFSRHTPVAGGKKK